MSIKVNNVVFNKYIFIYGGVMSIESNVINV